MTEKTVELYESEWHDEGYAMWLDGIEADIYPQDDTWVVIVKPTSKRSEFPELYDTADFATLTEAKVWAEEVVRKADSSYQHISY
jgi:hypothetical protein